MGFVWKYIFNQGSANRLVLLIVIWVALIATISFNESFSKAKNIKDSLIRKPDLFVSQVADWARKNTSIDSTFIIPPAWGTWEPFRGLSERSVFVAWKDGSAILWDRSFVKPWVDRLKAFGVDPLKPGSGGKNVGGRLNERYSSLTDNDVKKLGLNYGVKYWIVPLGHKSNFPVAFENKAYKVLEVR
jgi:hypothetical protein